MLHDWLTQVGALWPGVHVQRARVLGMIAFGMVWSGRIALLKIAEALPVAAADMSSEIRVRRWLKNDGVVVREVWRRLVTALLASRAGQEEVVVLDPTPQNGRFSILQLGVVCRRRVLPIAWRVVAQQTPWPKRQLASLRDLFAETAPALPPDGTVTVVADRGLTAAEVSALCRDVGWRPVFR